jgi:hypothetical protein
MVLMEDLIAHVNTKQNSENATVLERFLTSALPACTDVSISTKTLSEEHDIKEKDIT